jgi:Protein of unknown function (DUF559)
MSNNGARSAADLVRAQGGVITVATAIGWLGPAAVRWRLESGRWQRPYRGVLVTHSGPLSPDQALWVSLLACGSGAVLAGTTAAARGGLTGFEDRRTHILVPGHRDVRKRIPGVVVHRSVMLTAADVHPARRPPQTRMARSLLDAAAWAPSDNGARAILAAGVQQRIVRVGDLAAALARQRRLRRRALVSSTLADIEGGAEALSELDFGRLTRRYGIPEPERQVCRRDGAGRRRWLDAYWDYARLVAEVDGMWHMDAPAWWADMRRDNELTIDGYRVLRFPAFAVRDHPATVARQLAAALATAAPARREAPPARREAPPAGARPRPVRAELRAETAAPTT